MLANLTARIRALRPVDDTLPASHPDLRTWGSARTLQDIANINADWLLGCGPTYHPGSLGDEGPEHEDPALAGLLARINRAGLLTMCSQPGVDVRGWAQRPAITGVTSDRGLHSRLTSAAEAAGLIAHTPTRDGIVVTLRKGKPHTWLGRTWDEPEDLEFAWGCYGLLGRAAHQSIAAAQSLTLVDPQYGPGRGLWDVLDRAI